MNSFEENLRFESGFTDRLVGLMSPLMAQSGHRITVLTRVDGLPKQHLDVDLQKKGGDLLICQEGSGRIVMSVDLKVERQARPNLFFETHSNAAVSPPTLGWGHLLKVEYLWYAFADIEAMALIHLDRLRAWLVEVVEVPTRNGKTRPCPRLHTFEERFQTAHRQRNLTGGRLIPFRDIPHEVWTRSYLLDGGQARKVGRDEFLERLRNPDNRAVASAALPVSAVPRASAVPPPGAGGAPSVLPPVRRGGMIQRRAA